MAEKTLISYCVDEYFIANQAGFITSYFTDSKTVYTLKVLNIQEMFLTGKPQYPVERTLLISGALEALLESRYRGHVRIETPHLDVRYRSYEKTPIRPTNPRPTGPSAIPWRTEDTSG